MNRLFIHLYFDEDVNVLIADLVRAKGFDVTTARDAGQLRATDPEQLLYAVSQGRALVTHNRSDFEGLVQNYFSAGKTHYGVILAVRRPPQQLAKRLLAILNHVTADELQNQVRYI
ncbi:DUF5615 family PIN-like protein [Moorena producens JHB]|uniref:DUF5615 family PIN-like protein n=1 Tax=Moorena producens (strain JHB) TaxID=1454205 RepID=A0A1D9FXE7_MOOP1|nr:DUF5615 family PIN-like protein [Moorena producens]AOY79944.1 DUF5615 family PIN-like protein [Moorena producens JHB]